LAFELGNTLIDQAPVDFELAFTGTAEEPGAAALAFQMGPGPHQSAALVGKRRQVNLQQALGRARAVAEYFQN
jgi:hypothetical protein